MNDLFPQIVPCRPQDVEVLSKCASADGHGVIAPTFILNKGDQIVGYIGILPSVTAWLDTQRCGMRDSLVVQNFWENWLRNQGHPVINVNCSVESPLWPYLPKVGYKDIGARAVFKTLT